MSYGRLFVVLLDFSFFSFLEYVLGLPLDFSMNVGHVNLQILCRGNELSPGQTSQPISVGGFPESKWLVNALGTENDHVDECVIWFVRGLRAVPEDATRGEDGVDCVEDDLWRRHS